MMDMILDSVTAKGFEQDTYIESAIRDVGMFQRLEGTAHINIGLVVKFLQNYFFNPVDAPVIPRRDDPNDDSYIFQQQTGGLAKVFFPDYKLAYEGVDLPNVNIFKSQLELFKEFMENAAPSSDQAANIDYMLPLGEIFSLIVYAQLVLENCKIYKVEDDLVDQIFNLLVRDFSQFVLTQITDAVNSDEQEKYFREMLKKPAIDPEREIRLWNDHVSVLNGAYTMNP